MELLISIGIPVVTFVTGFIIGNVQRKGALTNIYLKGAQDSIKLVGEHYEFVPKDGNKNETVGFKLN